MDLLELEPRICTTLIWNDITYMGLFTIKYWTEWKMVYGFSHLKLLQKSHFVHYTPCLEKKRTNSILGITSSNTGRFLKFFQCHNLLEICNRTVIKFPTTPQARRYTVTGTFAPKNFRSWERKYHGMELSLLGTKVPRTFALRNFRSLEHSLPGAKVLGTFAPWNCRSLELSLLGAKVPRTKVPVRGTFVPWVSNN